MVKVRFVCSHCQGENVKVYAYAVWDFEAQQWVAEIVSSRGHCDNCQGETSIEEKEA